MFNAQAFLDSTGVPKTVAEYGRGETVFTQGDACEHVFYIQGGGVKLSVLSKNGREAVVAMLGPGDFFGEGCLAGQPVRMGSATAITPSSITLVAKQKMVRLLHKQHAMSDRFISTCCRRIDRGPDRSAVHSGSTRCAAGALRQNRRAAGSQETLAKMTAPPAHVNFFLNKFKRLGFIEYDGDIAAQRSTTRCSASCCD